MMRALDLFCGAAGGWTLGLHRAGIETGAACEADPWRRAVFGARWPAVRLYDDVRTLTGAQVIADVGPVDLVAGSPPCPDFSSANAKGAGIDGARGALFFDAIRIVRELRPAWVALENVPGIRTRGIDRVLAGLEAEGYACWPLVVGAVHAGAPHRRQRVWIVAHANAPAVFEPAFARREPDRVAAGAAADASGIDWDTGAGSHVAFAESGGPLAGYRDWNGGPPDLGRVDARISAALAARRGLGRACLAAYGDAVLPQIAEAIGRAIMSADADLHARVA